MDFSPETFAAHLREGAARLEGNLIQAEAETLRDLAAEAHKLSSAPSAPGTPYSRRNPDSSADPATLSRQGGEFDNSWRETLPSAGDGGITSELHNDSDHAQYMDGTKKMIKRPIMERLEQTLADRHERRAGDALVYTFTGER